MKREKSTWELMSDVWHWLCDLNYRRFCSMRRQRNMTAGVLVVVLIDLLIQTAGR